MALDINTLTLGEIAALEKMSGLSVDQMGDDASPKGDLLAAMAVIVKKRAGDTDFTFKKAQQLSMAEVQKILGQDDEDEPGKDEPSPKRGRKTSQSS